MAEEERRIEWMRLDELAAREAKNNSRVHNVPKLTEAITGLGFTAEPKIDETTGELVWGHGRLRTLRQLRDRGEKPPEGVRVDADGEWLAPVIRGWASRGRRHAMAVREADNRQGELGGYDDALRLDNLSELAGEEPDLLAGTGYASEDLDRWLEEASSGITELPPADFPDEPDRASSRRERDDEQWRDGDDPDEGSTRENDGPGPLDVEPAWRTIEPVRGRYHDGTPDGADAVARWLRSHSKDVHVDHQLGIAFDTVDGTEYLPPGKWVVCYRGRLTVMTREEKDDEFVPANEPARRLDRDAKPVKEGKATVPSAAEMLRNGTGVLLGHVGPDGLQVDPVGDVLDTAPHE